MATIKFRLRTLSETSPQPVYLVFRHKNEKLVLGTGLKVAPDHWNAEKQRVKNTTQAPDRDAINAALTNLKAETEKYYAEGIAARSFTVERLKKHLQTYQGGDTKQDTKNFLAFVRQFIEESPKRVQPNGKSIDLNTVAKYKATLHLVEAFTQETRRVLLFDDIDLDFYHDFTKWLHKRPHRKGTAYSANAVGKHIQTIKTFMNAATEAKLTENRAFQSKHFKATKEESDNVYLSEDELNALLAFSLDQVPHLERVRDMFIIGAWTGLRFSDFSKFNPRKYIKGDFIEIETEKTGARVVIPLFEPVRIIIEKYAGQLPAPISNQKFNDYIKEVCRRAGINQPTLKGMTVGGVRRIDTFEKWQMISTHTARRSFATNAYKAGVPAISIMQITGHKTERAFLKYIKATAQEHAQLMFARWSKSQENQKTIKIAL